MVDISRETADEAERRLRRVITQTRLHRQPGTWAFHELPLDAFPEAVCVDALALVHDEDVWSQLVPSQAVSDELFGVFSMHFPEGIDNSGFVGWLATHLKRRFGTGVFVVCGSNPRAGGIFDHWGVPAALAGEVFSEVQALVASGAARS